MSGIPDPGDFTGLASALAARKTSVRDVARAVLSALDASGRPEAWIHRASADALLARADALDALGPDPEARPLHGLPFAVKDNIDVAGMPTTAGCPAYAYVPERSAAVVARLEEAGALCVGKTHLDQFATGLVGTRSPHGPCRNAFSDVHVAGGSSSGSAVAVALGLVSFALGTDTAGSGRVPASYGGIVGLKPTRGLLSLRGVVPACASLDCVSVFARSASGAARVLEVARGFDAEDPFSRRAATPAPPVAEFRFGVPRSRGRPEIDDEGVALLEGAVGALESIGGRAVEFDDAPLREAAALLYGGPWVAERLAAVGDFVKAHRDEVDPTVASIILGGESLTARDAFEGQYALRALRRRVEPLFGELDLFVVATTPRALTLEEVRAEPVAANDLLAPANNFMNLLDLCGCVVPAGVRVCGVPFGVTLCAPAHADARLLDLAARLEGGEGLLDPRTAGPDEVPVLVVGAHLRGMPLDHQLTDLGGRFLEAVRTSADYRLHALDASPPKPGLRRVDAGGVAIEAELWALSVEAFGRFTLGIPRPLAMGRVTLEDGREVPGFVCEPEGLGGEDVSHFGGWRAYMASRG